MGRVSFLLALWVFSCDLCAQCNAYRADQLSKRTSNYMITADLDHASHEVAATQRIVFHNQSDAPVPFLRFYMYLNAFKNTESTFLLGATQIFGQDYTSTRTKDDWGWIHVDKILRPGGAPLVTYYVQPNDGNLQDQTVLHVALDKPVAPRDSLVLELNWRAKMPKTIARAGHSKDFYLFCHWFPQLGVWEQKLDGKWDWNCHQFFRTTEFFADFGTYDITTRVDQQFVMGSSGCLVSEKILGNGKVERHYRAEDVIDFAWSIYPDFEVLEQDRKGVRTRILYPPEHAAMAKRYQNTLFFALDWLESHVGKYPYPSITVVDPPFHGLRSGLMEYPTLVTVGTFYGTPSFVHNSESLLVHEFVHQYFMGMVASNEKEEAWLDEGFVTYYEDRIIDDLFGEKESMLQLYAYHFGNRELTRSEYTRMKNPRDGIIARPGWEFTDINRKSLIYSKTATTLASIEQILGVTQMDTLMQAWFEAWKFKHPRGIDFVAHLRTHVGARSGVAVADCIVSLFSKSIYEPLVLDAQVVAIGNENLLPRLGFYGVMPDSFANEHPNIVKRRAYVEVQRIGDWVEPTEVLITFVDGSTQKLAWNGQETKIFEFFDGPDVLSAQIDPEQHLLLDIDLNNNSKTLAPNRTSLWRYTLQALFFVQQCLQSISFLV
jgi:Peptidase family M1 domain